MTAARKKRKPNRRKSYKAQPIREVTLAPAPWAEWDRGSRAAANTERLVEEDAVEFDHATGKPRKNVNGVRRMRRQPWVEIYFKQGKLTKQQAAVAEILFASYAGHAARDPLAAIGEIVDGTKCDDPNVNGVDARRQFFAMWRQIPQRCRPVIEHVVLNDRPLRGMAGCADGSRELVYMKRLIDGLEILC